MNLNISSDFVHRYFDLLEQSKILLNIPSFSSLPSETVQMYLKNIEKNIRFLNRTKKELTLDDVMDLSQLKKELESKKLETVDVKLNL